MVSVFRKCFQRLNFLLFNPRVQHVWEFVCERLIDCWPEDNYKPTLLFLRKLCLNDFIFGFTCFKYKWHVFLIPLVLSGDLVCVLKILKVTSHAICNVNFMVILLHLLFVYLCFFCSFIKQHWWIHGLVLSFRLHVRNIVLNFKCIHWYWNKVL